MKRNNIKVFEAERTIQRDGHGLLLLPLFLNLSMIDDVIVCMRALVVHFVCRV